jgi:hypothetical protein
MAAALDFFTSGESTAVEAPPIEQAEQKTAKKTASILTTETTDDNTEEILGEIASMLMPAAADEEGGQEPPPEKQPAKKAAAEPDRTPVISNPPVHSPQLLQLATSWGIGPEDAVRYPSDEALLGAVAIREIRYRKAVEVRDGAAKAKEARPDPLAPPELKFDEDIDPAIKANMEAVRDYAKRLREYTDAQVKEAREEVEELKAEHQQAVSRETRQEETKIAALFDERVSAWGNEFKELIGVPQETWKQPGTPQHAELQKLRNYVLRSTRGHEALTGQSAGIDDIASFIEEARGAIWPQMARKSARSEIAAGLRKQKGGVGLRPGSTRSAEPPEQGDSAAKFAIAEKLTDYGLNPWAKRSA